MDETLIAGVTWIGEQIKQIIRKIYILSSGHH